ncbi:MAG: aminoglycoside phosphotransferase family protein [Acidimicrobiales bacterium]
MPIGWGNENWLVVAADGSRFVLKVGPPESAPKWSATGVAYRRAADLGVPAPRLLHFDPACADADGRVVRIFSWVEGSTSDQVITDGATSHRFFGALGAVVRTLHREVLPAFSSRLDGSAPSFRRWDGYVSDRFAQIADRARAASAFTEAELTGLEHEIDRLAAAVSPVVRPTLCHRDLHLQNLLAHADGTLAGVLDFDCAEAWDPAVDLVKLRWQVFPRSAAAAEAFHRSYIRDDPLPEHWQERLRLVDLLELINAVANACQLGDQGYEQAARARLVTVLDRDQDTRWR